MPLIAPQRTLSMAVPMDTDTDTHSDVHLLAQLTSNRSLLTSRRRRRSKLDRAVTAQRDIAMTASSPFSEHQIDGLYPMWRWSRLCRLLQLQRPEDQEAEFKALGWFGIKESRRRLAERLESMLCLKTNRLPDDTLLNVVDQFIKCQLLQSDHFNLRSNEVSLTEPFQCQKSRVLRAKVTFSLKCGHFGELNRCGGSLCCFTGLEASMLLDFGENASKNLVNSLVCTFIFLHACGTRETDVFEHRHPLDDTDQL